MSAVVKLITGIVNAIVGVVESIINVVVDLAETLWKGVLVPILEFVAGLFGVEDEDIIETQVLTQRIVQEDIVSSNLITKIQLEEMQAEIGVIDRLMSYTQLVRNKYNKYFNYGDTTFIDGLPEGNLRSLYINEALIKNIIDTEYNIDCTILSSNLGVIDKYYYVGFYLQNNYGYLPYDNILAYDGYPYSVTNIDYNYDTDLYDIYLRSVEDITTDTTTTTTITVTTINSTTDSVNTVVTEQVVTTSSLRGELSNTTTEISNTIEEVSTGTVTSSEVVDTTSTIAYDVIWSETMISVTSYRPVRYYAIKYYTTNSGEWLYWVYEAGSGGYPELDASDTYIGNLEMMPIITLRNSTININIDKNSDRYKQSQAMLKFLGLDVDTFISNLEESPTISNIEDAFVHFGLVPSENSDVVSKALYLTFDFIYNDSGLIADGDKYTATIREGSFNAAVAWEAQSRVITTGIIGNKGTYSHEINGKNLIIKHQATEEQYVTITITNLSSITFVDRQGLMGTVAKDVDQAGFFVPVSYYIVKKLTPLEQYELFNRALLLSIYSADVIHLEWYETKAFGDLLGAIGIVLSIVSFGYSLALNGLTATVGYTLLATAIATGATMLLKMVMESTDNEFLKALTSVFYVVAMVSLSDYGMAPDVTALTKTVTLFATSLSGIGTAISTYTAIEMDKLAVQSNVFSQQLKEKEEELSKAEEVLTPYTAMYDVMEVLNVKGPKSYIEGVDAMMYRAIGIQYEFSKVYDYDRMVGDFYTNKYNLGII